jgi:hypothetical protein
MKQVGKNSLSEIFSLSETNSSADFSQGTLSLASNLSRDLSPKRSAVGANILGMILEKEGVPEAVKSEARHRLDVMGGGGGTAAQLVQMGRGVVSGLSYEPEMLLPMVLAGPVGRTVSYFKKAKYAAALERGVTLSRWANLRAGLWGFGAENTVFSMGGRGLRALIGEVTTSIEEDFLRSGATLGILHGASRVAGGLFAGAVRGLRGTATPLNGAWRAGQVMTSQVGVYGGLVAEHTLLEEGGHNPWMAGLNGYLNLTAGMWVGRAALNTLWRGFDASHQALTARLHELSRARGGGSDSGMGTLSRWRTGAQAWFQTLAEGVANGGMVFVGAGPGRGLPDHVFAATNNSNDGPPPPSRPSAPRSRLEGTSALSDPPPEGSGGRTPPIQPYLDALVRGAYHPAKQALGRSNGDVTEALVEASSGFYDTLRAIQAEAQDGRSIPLQDFFAGGSEARFLQVTQGYLGSRLIAVAGKVGKTEAMAQALKRYPLLYRNIEGHLRALKLQEEWVQAVTETPEITGMHNATIPQPSEADVRELRRFFWRLFDSLGEKGLPLAEEVALARIRQLNSVINRSSERLQGLYGIVNPLLSAAAGRKGDREAEAIVRDALAVQTHENLYILLQISSGTDPSPFPQSLSASLSTLDILNLSQLRRYIWLRKNYLQSEKDLSHLWTMERLWANPAKIIKDRTASADKLKNPLGEVVRDTVHLRRLQLMRRMEPNLTWDGPTSVFHGRLYQLSPAAIPRLEELLRADEGTLQHKVGVDGLTYWASHGKPELLQTLKQHPKYDYPKSYLGSTVAHLEARLAPKK